MYFQSRKFARDAVKSLLINDFSELKDKAKNLEKNIENYRVWIKKHSDKVEASILKAFSKNAIDSD